MQIDRRTFLRGAGAAAAGAALLPQAWGAPSAIRIGACVVDLAQAKQAGLDGVEVNVGGPADRLEIADPQTQARYQAQMRETGLPICSLMMGLLNQCPLASDQRGPAWLEQSIDAARELGAKVILVAFFGKGDLLDGEGKVKEAEVEVVVQRLKAAAPRAREAGVILAIENYLDARQNSRILERIGHESVKIYYDCFNTGATKGYDVPAELRLLKGQVAQIHFKNGPKYLEDGQVKYGPVAAAIKEIGFEGWIVLETSSPSKDRVADARRNGEYARGLFR